VKTITMKSKSPIKIDGSKMLSLINNIRAGYGEEGSHKEPISLESFLSSCNVMQNRDETHGMISLSLNYVNKESIPCTRDFPNFGLEVSSSSNLSQHDGEVHLDIDFTVKAGSPKWQKNEIAECAEALSSSECAVKILVTLDEKTEWAGRSSIIELKDFSNRMISVENFDVIVK
jgi:hypothetical protein